jgi:GxxExxY protein
MQRIVEHANKEIIYPELSYLITGVLFSVHNELGQYGKEKQYGDLLEQKLREANLSFKREVSVGDSGNILDFVVENKIALELKATRLILKEHYRQLQNYLQQTGLKLGLLVNFRDGFIKPRRVIRIDAKENS